MSLPSPHPSSEVLIIAEPAVDDYSGTHHTHRPHSLTVAHTTRIVHTRGRWHTPQTSSTLVDGGTHHTHRPQSWTMAHTPMHDIHPHTDAHATLGCGMLRCSGQEQYDLITNTKIELATRIYKEKYMFIYISDKFAISLFICMKLFNLTIALI